MNLLIGVETLKKVMLIAPSEVSMIDQSKQSRFLHYLFAFTRTDI